MGDQSKQADHADEVITKHVLPQHMIGGPKHLGEPDDKTLRHVERDQIIPKRMREKAKQLCIEKEKRKNRSCVFQACVYQNQWTFWKNCKAERKAVTDCEISYIQNPEFVQTCTEEYLSERSEYRRTGKTHKQRVVAAYQEKHAQDPQ